MTSDVRACAPREEMRLPTGTTVGKDAKGRTVLGWGSKRFAIGPLLDGAADVVHSLARTAATTAELAARAAEGDPATAAQVHHVLERLGERGWLERTVRVRGRALASLRPFGAVRVPVDVVALGPKDGVALSRFALLRREGDEMVVRSPRSTSMVVLHDPHVAALLASLSSYRLVGDLAAEGFSLPENAVDALLRLLGDAGLLVQEPEGGVPAEEDATMALAQWSAADLGFHAASRYGRQLGGYGGTFPLRSRFEPLPERRPDEGGSIDLDRPDLAGLTITDLPFTAVIEGRRSIREHDDRSPLTLDQLGDLLYRAAGARPASGENGGDAGTWTRPYPSGGGLYELDLYPVVNRCVGLDPGLYRYDPVVHRLRLVTGAGPAVERLLDDARARGLMAATPQVLLVVAARFGRMMFKYESMAYAAILKNVGVLYQSLYGVATAMGLAPCALGGGCPDAFSAATGLDYYSESSVGEFLVGSATGSSRRPLP